jgi:nucleoside-diphosphate-sugar epimerase
MRILVLGGTGWLGRTVARTALRSGHDVTCLARGVSGDVADGVRFVRADRGSPEAYDAVAGRAWDGVVDVARHPGHVRRAVAALGDSTACWAFVSTGNVYASHAGIGDDESAPLLEPLAADEMTRMEEYGAAKVACEQAVLGALGEWAVIARAGLLGGPGDESGRSGWWPWRFAHPAGTAGEVLVPAARLESALVDVRDVAAWLVRCVEDGTSGVFDVVAHRMTLAEHLDVARAVAGHDGPLVPVADAWLLEQGVREWMGPRSLPLWLGDPEWRGFAARRGEKILAHGLAPRPLARTLADTLAWEEARTGGVPHGAGLTDDEERALLAQAADAGLRWS